MKLKGNRVGRCWLDTCLRIGINGGVFWTR